MQHADAAIAGRLLRVLPGNDQRLVYRYRIQRVYKSGGGIEPGSVLSVSSAQGSSACSLPTDIGRRYSLLLSHTVRGWSSGACGLLGKFDCTN
jgi:hypothetical protein